MKIRKIVIVGLVISWLLAVPACAKPPSVDPDLLDLKLSLVTYPTYSDGMPLLVDVKAGDIRGKARITATLPKRVRFASEEHSWEVEVLPGEGAHKVIQLKLTEEFVEEGSLAQIKVQASGKSISGENIIAEKSIFVLLPSQNQQGPSSYRTPPGPMMEIYLAVSPEPVAGQTIYIQTWTWTYVDVSDYSFVLSYPKDLSLVNGSDSISRKVFDPTETIKLDSELLITKAGEWPVKWTANGTVTPDGQNTVGREILLYLQSSTSLGTTITEHSISELQPGNQGQTTP